MRSSDRNPHDGSITSRWKASSQSVIVATQAVFLEAPWASWSRSRIEGLTGREYKIMLEPGRFSGAPDKAARRFWNRLASIVALCGRKAGPGGFDDVFPKGATSGIRFKDTPRLLLDKHGYSLRIREGDHKRK